MKGERHDEGDNIGGLSSVVKEPDCHAGVLAERRITNDEEGPVRWQRHSEKIALDYPGRFGLDVITDAAKGQLPEKCPCARTRFDYASVLEPAQIVFNPLHAVPVEERFNHIVTCIILVQKPRSVSLWQRNFVPWEFRWRRTGVVAVGWSTSQVGEVRLGREER